MSLPTSASAMPFPATATSVTVSTSASPLPVPAPTSLPVFVASVFAISRARSGSLAFVSTPAPGATPGK